MQLSIIIPTFNEATSLSITLDQLIASTGKLAAVEIIICDGGSKDDTLNQASQFPAIILNTQKGRAVQMNAGAQQAKGDWLIFLHADTRLPQNWIKLILLCKTAWGRFDVQLSGQHWLFRLIEKAINIRSCKTSVATGDQALFFRRDFFNQLGGFP